VKCGSDSRSQAFAFLSGRRVGDKFASALAAGLHRVNPPPTHVFLRDNRLTGRGVRRLFSGLSTSNLTVLDLGHNRLGKTGVAALARLLQVRVDVVPFRVMWLMAGVARQGCRYLQHLNVEHNNLPDNAITLLIEALYACPTVKHLVLRGNQCALAGSLAIGKFLAWQELGNSGSNKVKQAVGILPTSEDGVRREVSISQEWVHPDPHHTHSPCVSPPPPPPPQTAPRLARQPSQLDAMELRTWVKAGNPQGKVVRRPPRTPRDGLQELDVAWNQIGGRGAIALLHGLALNNRLKVRCGPIPVRVLLGGCLTQVDNTDPRRFLEWIGHWRS